MSVNELTWDIVKPYYNEIADEFYRKNKKKIIASTFPFKEDQVKDFAKRDILTNIEDKYRFDIDCNFGNTNGINITYETIEHGVTKFLDFYYC